MSTTVQQDEKSLFFQAYRGQFWGVLRWPQLDELWDRVLADREGGWYLYALGEPPPLSTSHGEDVETFVRELDALLHEEHDEDYCGIVYADNLQSPAFIKVFDPHNLGSVCGSSGKPALPGWILCKIRPEDLPASLVPNNRRRWWKRLFPSLATA